MGEWINMTKDKNSLPNPYKGWMIFLTILVIVMACYMAFDKYSSRYNDGYQAGIVVGVDTTVRQLARQSDNCQVVEFAVDGKLVQLVGVNCVQR